MSLDQCRRAVDAIGKARELLRQAYWEGELWLRATTLSRVADAINDLGRLETFAESELNKHEKRARRRNERTE